MINDNFPPVGWLNQREAWNSPQTIGPTPHNLPVRHDPAVTGSTVQNANVFPDTVSVRENYRYASIVDISINVDTTSFKFLDQPIGKRNFLGFRNASSGTQNLYIGFGGPASTNSWLRVTPGTVVLFDTVVPQDDLYVLSDGASATFSYVYSTFPG